MLKINRIYNMDCLLGIQKMLEQNMQVDLIVTDPPYFIKSTKAGGKSELARSIQPMNDQLAQNRLTVGIEEVYLKAMWDVMKVPNIYLWCNGAQIPQYIDFLSVSENAKWILSSGVKPTPHRCFAINIYRTRNIVYTFGAEHTVSRLLMKRQRLFTICQSISRIKERITILPSNRFPLSEIL